MRTLGLRRSLAQLLVWVTLLILIAGLGTTLAGLRLIPPGLWIGGTLAGLGLSTLLVGELVAGPLPKPFTARGQVVRGELIVRAGPADLTVSVCGADRIATVRHGPLGRPKFAVQDGVAQLKMSNGLIPSITQWQADLARNVLWDLDLRSGLGELVADLSHLRVERVAARTGMGRIEITCPTRGYSQMTLRAGAGDIEVRIPENVGVRLQIRHGELATLRIDNERVQATGSRRYATPDFDSAATQIEIRIDSSAGDIVIL